MGIRYKLESVAVASTKKQPRRRASTDHRGDEFKEHFTNVAFGHCVDEVGRAGESELGDSLRPSKPSDELAVRRGGDEEQGAPAGGLFHRKRGRPKNDCRSNQHQRLD